MSFREFLHNVNKLAKNAKKRFINQFTDTDRKLLLECLQLSRSGITEQELLKKWRES